MVTSLLYCALNLYKFNQISICKMARDIWRTIEIIGEGTNQVKKTRINMVVYNYEMFKMRLEESIKEMFNIYSRGDIVRKILMPFLRS